MLGATRSIAGVTTTSPGIQTARVGAVARVTLDRPQQRNALSLDLMRELVEALDAIADDAESHVVVLAANGPAFSAGHDLREMTGECGDAFFTELFDTCVRLMERLHSLPQPVIARVHGVATAAGCQLVAACDLAVCTDDARFATPGVNIGLFCSTPMVPITRAVGRKRAMQMLLTGEMIDAPTALEWGLVNQVVAPDELDAAVATLAAKIASASPAVVALGKHAFYSQIDADESTAYERTAPVMARNAQMDDAQEGMRAFLEKRTPRWTGR
jgi:enoyl-CoA hydratase/carnithine racemase